MDAKNNGIKNIQSKGKSMICYGQVNTGHWAQEHYETASKDAGRRARQLRKSGFSAISSSLGLQVTNVGLVRMTMVDIRPGCNQDTFYLPTTDWTLETK